MKISPKVLFWFTWLFIGFIRRRRMIWRTCKENIFLLLWMNNRIITLVIFSEADALNKFCVLEAFESQHGSRVFLSPSSCVFFPLSFHACWLFFLCSGCVTALWLSTRTESSSWKTTTSLLCRTAACLSTGSSGQREIIRLAPSRPCRWSCSRSWKVRRNGFGLMDCSFLSLFIKHDYYVTCYWSLYHTALLNS